MLSANVPFSLLQNLPFELPSSCTGLVTPWIQGRQLLTSGFLIRTQGGKINFGTFAWYSPPYLSDFTGNFVLSAAGWCEKSTQRNECSSGWGGHPKSIWGPLWWCWKDLMPAPALSFLFSSVLSSFFLQVKCWKLVRLGGLSALSAWFSPALCLGRSWVWLLETWFSVPAVCCWMSLCQRDLVIESSFCWKMSICRDRNFPWEQCVLSQEIRYHPKHSIAVFAKLYSVA